MVGPWRHSSRSRASAGAGFETPSPGAMTIAQARHPNWHGTRCGRRRETEVAGLPNRRERPRVFPCPARGCASAPRSSNDLTADVALDTRLVQRLSVLSPPESTSRRCPATARASPLPSLQATAPWATAKLFALDVDCSAELRRRQHPPVVLCRHSQAETAASAPGCPSRLIAKPG